MFDCSMEDVKNLVELQKNISDCLNLELFFKNSLQKLEEIDRKQVKADTLVKTLNEQLAKLRKEYEANETELKKVEDGITKSNLKLASVKNQKEYQSIQKEISDLNVQAHELSDVGLKLLEKIETVEKQFGPKEEEIRVFLANSAKQRQELEKKALLAKKQLQKLDDNAKKLKAQVDSYLLEILEDSVRHNINHLGVVKVEDAICQGCNVNVPRQIYNELLKTDGMELCPTCRRLIYCEQKVSTAE